VRVVMFYHSLVSDWNHGNAHFLRGVATELQSRGHDVEVFEPGDGWSYRNLIQDHGIDVLQEFQRNYPTLSSTQYDLESFDLDAVLGGADLVLVHEWNNRELVQRIGRHHAKHDGYWLLFHDTHHRAVSSRDEMAAYDLSGYDGALVFGRAIRDRYVAERWCRRVFVWHEAADTNRFYPQKSFKDRGQLVWIGNWGDGERAAELDEYLIRPVAELGLKAVVHGVRYPAVALQRLAEAGIEYRGWLPNWDVARVFGANQITIHVPRRPYVEQLPGIPTIRMFEALACGIPLVSAYWSDAEHLFTLGKDYLVAHSGREMRDQLNRVLSSPALRAELADHGRSTILASHTCAHRVAELFEMLGYSSPNDVNHRDAELNRPAPVN
jgi:spore maturation protein CgeB